MSTSVERDALGLQRRLQAGAVAAPRGGVHGQLSSVISQFNVVDGAEHARGVPPVLVGPPCQDGRACRQRSRARASIDDLDDQQRQAVVLRAGRCVCWRAPEPGRRGPSPGESRTGAAGHVAPGQVLAVTFTPRAAGEMRGRLRALDDPGRAPESVQARTFHAAALRQLRYSGPAWSATPDGNCWTASSRSSRRPPTGRACPPAPTTFVTWPAKSSGPRPR